jgi:hypothetical protein
VMLIGTWVYSHVVPENNKCFASLVWYISRYGEVGLILLSVSAGIMMFNATTIFIRLSMVKIIDKQQRISASRIVYYHILGIVSLVSELIISPGSFLTKPGLCHSIFCLSDRCTWQYQVIDDGRCSPQFIGIDGRTSSSVPQV